MGQWWLILCWAIGSANSANTTTLTRFLLDVGKYPLAVCNDGSPAGMYLRPSPSGRSTDWLLFQQGGGWCYDPHTCAERAKVAPALTSSKGWPATQAEGGIFASTHANFEDMNLVFVPYCTSDGFAGSVTGPPALPEWSFRGHDVVTAVVQDLVATHGMGSKPGSTVLYSGCSAGARGALFNLDRVGALLAALTGGRVSRFGGLLDSCFWVDMPHLPTANGPTFMEQARDVMALANASASAEDSCSAEYSGLDEWKCIYGVYRLPYTKSDYFLHSYQYDLFQLQGDTGVAVPDKTPEQIRYCEQFRNATRAGFLKDVAAVNRTGTAALLPACFKHCNTLGSTFSTLKTNGFSLEEAVAGWWWHNATVPRYIVEDCTGFNCGTDCPAAS